MRQINWLVVHTAATRPSMDIGAKEIRRWHKERGFADIGYHYVIRRDGKLERGRAESRAGAHVRGHNRDSLGICLVGGVNERTLKPENNYTPAQWNTLISLLKRLSKKYPQANVRGHRDFPGVAKACPCFDAEPWARKHGFKTVGSKRQWVSEMKSSRTVAGQSMVAAGTASGVVDTQFGDSLSQAGNEISMVSYISEWLGIAAAVLIVGGIMLTLYARMSDAKSNPKFEGTAPEFDSD